MNLLYVEDNVELAYTLKDRFSVWFNVDVVFSCEAGLRRTDRTDYDVILLDYALPDNTGLELCRQIRRTNQESLILFLTSNSTKPTILSAFESGADDYIAKPFDFEELLARLQASLRRRLNHRASGILKSGHYVLNQNTRELYYRRRKIALNRKEYLILEYLMINNGQIITRSQLYEHVWNREYYDSNTIDVHVRRLRSKVETPYGTNLIKTVYGVGYRIVKS